MTTHRRDIEIMGVVGVAHLVSHFYQLALAPLFPLISSDLGLSNFELGLLVSVFFLAAGGFQIPAGILVDRIGARPVLIGGLGLLSVAVTGYSIVPNFEIMLLLVFLAGAGNSVFHPADFSLLNNAVDPKLIGRAFSVHSLGAYGGFALAPIIMAVLATSLGWRGAVAIAGITGIAFTIVLFALGGSFFRQSEESTQTKQPEQVRSSISVLLKPSIIAFFLFFFIATMASSGLQNFTPIALVTERGLSLIAASAVVSGFLTGAPVGVLAGGILADRLNNRQDVAAMAAFAGVGLLILSVPIFEPTGTILFITFVAAGFFMGVVLPNRDVVIRSSTPEGASGRVYGFIYSGLDTGAAVTPVLYGWFLDLGHPTWIFYASGFLFLTAAMLVIATTRIILRPAGRSGKGR